MSILDDAFELAKAAVGSAGEEEARNQLRRRYPKASENEIADAYHKARKLVNACYDFGERCREKVMTDDEALQKMQKKFPGFSHSTYRTALSYGYFVSR